MSYTYIIINGIKFYEEDEVYLEKEEPAVKNRVWGHIEYIDEDFIKIRPGPKTNRYRQFHFYVDREEFHLLKNISGADQYVDTAEGQDN